MLLPKSCLQLKGVFTTCSDQTLHSSAPSGSRRQGQRDQPTHEPLCEFKPEAMNSLFSPKIKPTKPPGDGSEKPFVFRLTFTGHFFLPPPPSPLPSPVPAAAQGHHPSEREVTVPPRHPHSLRRLHAIQRCNLQKGQSPPTCQPRVHSPIPRLTAWPVKLSDVQHPKDLN